mgnify:CR=1 FL=1
MKKYFIAVLRPLLKGLYHLIKKCKRIVRKISVYNNSRLHKGIFIDKKIHTKTRRTPLWKDKRLIIAACAAVVVISVALGVVLPRPNNTAEAAVLDVLPSAGLGDNVSSEPPVSSADVQPSNTNVQSDLNKADVSLPDEASQATDTDTSPVPTTAPDTKPAATTAPEKKNLTPGCHDSQIIDVQTRLMELGYMGDDEPTDYYGYGTEYALQLFQRKANLQVDGLLGDKTMTALFSDNAQPYTVKLGDKGTDVEGIQDRLHELNYLKSAGTGYFGTDTETAVKSFQTRNSLTADGNVGNNTFEMLYSDDAKPAITVSKESKNDSKKDSSKSDNKNDSKKDSSKSNNKNDSKKNSGKNDGKKGTKSDDKKDDDKTTEPAAPNEASASALIDFAKTQLGKKYVHGGKGPNGFDCSGFVYYCLNKVGYQIKYMTSAGWAKCGISKVSSMSDLKKGDIVCFKGHVGIYMGDGNMIDASSSQGKIRICSNIFKSSYWKKTFICGRRVF